MDTKDLKINWTDEQYKNTEQVEYNNLITKYKGFFAFGNKQFYKSLAELGIETETKITHFGSGLYMPSANVDDFLKESDVLHKSTKKKIKEIKNTEYIKFWGINDSNHAIFESTSTGKRRYYGDVNELFDYNTILDDVLNKISIDYLCYYGDDPNAEPYGTTPGKPLNLIR